MTYPGVEMLGKGILDVVRDGVAQAECIIELAKRYPSAAAVTIMDLSAEAEAFGCPVQFSDVEVPTVVAPIAGNLESIRKLRVPNVGSGRTEVYLTAAGLAGEDIMDRPVFGGHIGPLSLAARIYGMSEIMLALMLEPDTVHQLLTTCTQFLVAYARAFKATGVNGILIAEPAAGLTSPAACAEFSSQYVKRIVDAVQDDHFMVTLHNCGNTRRLVPSLVTTGALGLHFGNAVDMADVLPQIPPDRLAMGNLDPAGVLCRGTAEEVTSRTLDLLEHTRSFPNFVLSSGCDVPPHTPLENVNAFYEALRKFNTIRA